MATRVEGRAGTEGRAGARGRGRRIRARAPDRIGALAAVALVALGGCASPGEGDVDQAPAETVAIEVEVKRALFESDAVGGAAIGVEVGEDGTVTLDGFVDSEAEREEALRLAREALGGREPVDALEVR